MPRPRSTLTAPRKLPKQARSAELVGAILQAGIRVLERDGADAFTTVRVAEQAGVSVGSLYQYFPNKESILARLQEQEWARTGQLLDGIFTDPRLGPAERLRVAVQTFFHQSADEGATKHRCGVRWGTPPRSTAVHPRGARAKLERGARAVNELIGQVAPGLPSRRRAFATQLYFAVMTSMGEHSLGERSRAGRGRCLGGGHRRHVPCLPARREALAGSEH